MEEVHIHILDDHGDLSEESCLHTHIWMRVSNKSAGIIGAKPRMKGALVFMNTGTLFAPSPT